MRIQRRSLLAASLALTAMSVPAERARADEALTVAYAGSMDKVMDGGLNPAFAAATGIAVHGIGRGAIALARLIAGGVLKVDVFVPISAEPAEIVRKAGLAETAVPVASTSIVLAYSPASKFAAQFAAAKGADWTKIFSNPDFHLARSDPTADPGGRYVLFALQLAEKYYNLPGFAAKIAGPMVNPAQFFAEPVLLARLRSGQVDALFGYKAAVLSLKLPFIELPDAVNLSNPALEKSVYAEASLTLTSKDGKTETIHPTPLVYYALALKGAANPKAVAEYMSFLTGAEGQSILERYGYGPGRGPSI